jgi:DNA polymerase-3 subunit beta
LNGIFISLKDHKMTMVATDGRRLALVDEEMDVAEKSQGEFIVPAKAVNELNRLLQDKGEVEIKLRENQASFALKDDKGFSVLIITKLIEGNYPNYRQVIPARPRSASRWSRGIPARPAPRRDHDQREIQFRQAELWQEQAGHHRQFAGSRRGAETLAINYKGKEIAIAFNPRYVIDPLNALSRTRSFSN